MFISSVAFNWFKMQAEMSLSYVFQISEDAELLWRLARVSRDVAQLSRTSEAERKLLVYEALEYAKRALEKNGASFAAHKVRGWARRAGRAWGVRRRYPAYGGKEIALFKRRKGICFWTEVLSFHELPVFTPSGTST